MVGVIDSTVSATVSCVIFCFYRLVSMCKLLFYAVSQPIDLIINLVFPDLHSPLVNGSAPSNDSIALVSSQSTARNGNSTNIDDSSNNNSSSSSNSNNSSSNSSSTSSSSVFRPAMNVFLSIVCIGICSVIIVHMCEIIVDNLCVEKSTVGATLLALGSGIILV